MKKVGIITLHVWGNYGQTLQNYAVFKTLKKINCRVVNVIKKNTFRFLIKIIIWHLLRTEGKRRYYLFCKFDMHSMIGYMPCKGKLDYYICGSDQIWHPEWFGQPFHFAAFASPKKRISYAASFGVSEIPDKRKADYTKYLSEMKEISVREQAGVEIVYELTGRKAEVHVDPTMLLTKAEWQKIEKKPRFNIGGKFVFTYFLGHVSNSTRQYIKNICMEKGLKLINLEQYAPNEYWYKTGPAEFVWLIEHCELILTDSFHGSVFSILMDVPFLVFEREDDCKSMSSRIDTLLGMLKLEGRRFNNQSIEDAFYKDYSHVPAILEHERQRSIEYLKRAMDI